MKRFDDERTLFEDASKQYEDAMKRFEDAIMQYKDAIKRRRGNDLAIHILLLGLRSDLSRLERRKCDTCNIVHKCTMKITTKNLQFKSRQYNIIYCENPYVS